MTPETAKKTRASKAAKLPVRDFASGKVTTMAVPSYLSTSASPRLIAQVLHTQRKRLRVRRAHTKERAEVRGGGRKPWKQKGTGRARHGSRRSPIWVGGGTTFGPRSRHERVLPVPAAMRRRAFAGAMTDMLAHDGLAVVRFGAIPEKTKEFAQHLPQDVRNLLILTTAERMAAVSRVARNVPAVRVASVDQATVGDVVWAGQIWIDEEALSQLELRCGSTTPSAATK